MNRRDFFKRAAAVSCAAACGEAIAPVVEQLADPVYLAGADIPTCVFSPDDVEDLIAATIKKFSVAKFSDIMKNLVDYELKFVP